VISLFLMVSVRVLELSWPFRVRPISTHPFIAKLLEKVATSQLQAHLYANNLAFGQATTLKQHWSKF